MVHTMSLSCTLRDSGLLLPIHPIHPKEVIHVKDLRIDAAITSVRNGTTNSSDIALAQKTARVDFGNGGDGSRAREALKKQNLSW
jgi:hypothetical protein